MLNNKHLTKISILSLTIFIVLILIFSKIGTSKEIISYDDKIFDQTYIHTVEIEVDGFQEMLDDCFSELYRPCNITIDGEKFIGVGIRCKGNSSMESVVFQNSQRHSFKIEFDHYDKSKTYYGLDKLVLNNCESDYTYMIDYLVFSLMNETGADAPLCSYSFINVNGEPWGLYMSIESIEDSMMKRLYRNKKVNLYKPENPVVEDMEGIEFDELGYPIIDESFDWTTPDVRLDYRGDSYRLYKNIFDWAKTDIGGADKDRLIKSIKQLNNKENLDEILDIDNIIRFFALHNFVYNEDGYNGQAVHNYYLSEDDGRLNIYPWDYGLAFGTYKHINADDAINDPIDTPIDFEVNGKRPMFEWIVTDDKYKEQYHSNLESLIDYLIQSDICDRIETLRKELKPYIVKQRVAFCTVEQFDDAVDNLKLFFDLRIKSIQGQLAGELPSTRIDRENNPDKKIDTTNLDLYKLGWRSMRILKEEEQ